MPVTHVVAQGECLASIAARYGFADYTRIYDDPANAALKKKRADPAVIYPGDVVVIPDREEKWAPRATGASHAFQVRLARRPLRIALKDHEGKAVANVAYRIDVGGEALTGRTDGDGALAQELPADATEALVTLPDYGARWTIAIGHLDPVHDDDGDDPILSGIRARLVNLGYLSGAADDARTKEALARFQRDVLGRDPADGVPDRSTRDALVARHGC